MVLVAATAQRLILESGDIDDDGCLAVSQSKHATCWMTPSSPLTKEFSKLLFLTAFHTMNNAAIHGDDLIPRKR